MSDRDEGPSMVGVAVAACVACCVPLVLVVLGAVSLGGLVAAAFVGVTGLGVAALAALSFVFVRRRRRSGEPPQVSPPREPR